MGYLAWAADQRSVVWLLRILLQFKDIRLRKSLHGICPCDPSIPTSLKLLGIICYCYCFLIYVLNI